MSSIFDESQYAAREQAWNELVSALHSRLGDLAQEYSLQPASMNEPLPHELSMGFAGSHLSVWAHPEDGAASWNLIRPDLDMAVPWTLSADGIAFLDGQAMTIADAADRFAAKLSGIWHPAER